jgi:cytochrome c oxidase assembly protein subunit 15
MKFNTYQKVALTTVCATLFLIFVGGLVRASGAGLGCPDWPRCFGQWIPPFSVAELPSGFDPAQFNAVKMWTEYVNRIIGVLIGLLIIATAVLSLRYRKNKPSVTRASVAALILVLVQGWLGGQVVRSGLQDWIITLHMLLAMVIVSLLVFATFKAFVDQLNLHLEEALRKHVLMFTLIMLFASLFQMVLGTQVREAIDMVIKMNPGLPRAQWLEQVGFIDHFHRTTSWSLLILALYKAWFLSKHEINKPMTKTAIGIILLVFLQVLLGVGLAYLGMPAAFQVLHLFVAALLVSGLILYLNMVIYAKNQ